MTLEQLMELQQIKVNLFECYIAETKFADFLMESLEKHGSELPIDETFKIKWFSDQIYSLIQKIKIEQDKPPDKLPVYLPTGTRSTEGSRNTRDSLRQKLDPE